MEKWYAEIHTFSLTLWNNFPLIYRNLNKCFLLPQKPYSWVFWKCRANTFGGGRQQRWTCYFCLPLPCVASIACDGDCVGRLLNSWKRLAHFRALEKQDSIMCREYIRFPASQLQDNCVLFWAITSEVRQGINATLDSSMQGSCRRTPKSRGQMLFQR